MGRAKDFDSLIGLVIVLWLAAAGMATTGASLPENPPGVVVARFQRMIHGNSVGIAVECSGRDKIRDEKVCHLVSSQLDGKVTKEKIPTDRVEDVIVRFFKRLGSSSSSEFRSVASQGSRTPEKATYTFTIKMVNGTEASGGFSLDDINGLRLERKELLELVRYTEVELSRIGRGQ